jgi:hypothetical protein
METCDTYPSCKLPALLGGDGCQLGLLQLITGVRVISQVDLCADDRNGLSPPCTRSSSFHCIQPNQRKSLKDVLTTHNH